MQACSLVGYKELLCVLFSNTAPIEIQNHITKTLRIPNTFKRLIMSAPVRVISEKQSKAAKALFDPLATIESEYHDKRLGPQQVNRSPGVTGLRSLADFTCLRAGLETCHEGMSHTEASPGVAGIPKRYKECVTDQEKTDDPQVDRWAATRERIKTVYGAQNEQVWRAQIRGLDKLLELLKTQVVEVVWAFQTDENIKLPSNKVVTKGNVNPAAAKFKAWEPEQPASYTAIFEAQKKAILDEKAKQAAAQKKSSIASA
ncbi:hypothetical protein N0V83_006844 [Neocucurbitaria cava]|uniref:Uncharacterized protein n=1 Tax=Neocucurbitaria cava TaxID=798079 RepID=A0A9W8Y4Z6_9PLEO|nr:hypothetical protein N0V83_006844 [Neocucurbitaria cava]